MEKLLFTAEKKVKMLAKAYYLKNNLKNFSISNLGENEKDKLTRKKIDNNEIVIQ